MPPLLLRLLQLLRPDPARIRRKTGESSGLATYLETSPFVAGLIFVLTVSAIVLISFVGVSTVVLPVLPNQLASVRIVASEPFTYVSKEKTRLLREQIRERIPPVYRVDSDPLQQFESHLYELTSGLDTLAALPVAQRESALAALVETFNSRGPYRTAVVDVRQLLNFPDPYARSSLVEAGLGVLRSIHAQGIHDDVLLGASRDRHHLPLYQISRADGSVAERSVDSVADGLTYLRIGLSSERGDAPLSLALFRILRNGIIPNLVFDQESTEARRTQAIAQLKPVVVAVDRGQTIVEPDTRVTAEQYEMLVAHRQHIIEHGDAQTGETLQFLGRVLLVLAMVIASILYIRMEDPETLRSNGRLGLLALVVIVNLALVRTTFALGSLPYFLSHTDTASVLPYLAPVAIAPLVLAIMIDAGSAVFMALLISIFTSVIYGGRLDILVLTFLASMVAIHTGRNTLRRSNVVRAAALGGFTIAAFVLIIGLIDRIALSVIVKQMAAGLATGLVSGVIVAGLLPILEALFKRTTDITLLELTDYNHPLLRLMQMEAPGTYHHSLIVAQLAENAAAAIGANPLLARVCALYHDIGKTRKAEYFIENQRDGANPHDLNNPSLSALVIKSHVKDGVDIAITHKLPRAVIDVIRQHHGTSLIRYFYHRAVKDATRPPVPSAPSVPAGAPPRPESLDPFLPGLTPSRVSENTYRYDGPVPRFKESAIIHLADGVEAASRAMRRVTPQHLAELIEQIFRERIADGQLDEAPLTFAELATIKESFAHTLLNMLHGRVAYPAPEPGGSATPFRPPEAPATPAAEAS